MSNDIKGKSIFDLSFEQRRARLDAFSKTILDDLFARGLPVTYQDERCPTANHFIQQYEDGRVTLVYFDTDKLTTEYVKDLPHA